MNNVTQTVTATAPNLLDAALAAAENAPTPTAAPPRLTRGARVLVESPLAAPSSSALGLNQLYARAALRDCLLRGEAPMAAHILYGQTYVLDNEDPAEQKIGTEAGLSWLPLVDRVVVYTDRGMSRGMRETVLRAEELGVPVERRTLTDWERG